MLKPLRKYLKNCFKKIINLKNKQNNFRTKLGTDSLKNDYDSKKLTLTKKEGVTIIQEQIRVKSPLNGKISPKMFSRQNIICVESSVREINFFQN